MLSRITKAVKLPRLNLDYQFATLGRCANNDSALPVSHCHDQRVVELNWMLFPVDGDYEVGGRRHYRAVNPAI
jgi:hypothetical protein